MKNGGKLFGIDGMTNTLDKDGIQNVPLPLITRYFRRTGNSPLGKKEICSPGQDKQVVSSGTYSQVPWQMDCG